MDSCHSNEGQDADQPDYDSVASDEDGEREPVNRDDEDASDRHTKVPHVRVFTKFRTSGRSLEMNRFELFSFTVTLQSSESSDLSDGPITVQEFMEVKSALNASEAKIQQLLKLNCHLSEELRMMQGKVGRAWDRHTWMMAGLRWAGPGMQHA